MLTRRKAIAILGAGGFAFAQKTATPFPKGAIIRTVLKDLRPEELMSGATLFHEHMSLEPGFLPKFASLLAAGRGGPAPAQPATPGAKYFLEDLDLLTEELRAAKTEGVSCLVDGGHPDM